MEWLRRYLPCEIAGTIGDLYMTLFDGVMGVGLGKVPTANRQLTEILV